MTFDCFVLKMLSADSYIICVYCIEVEVELEVEIAMKGSKREASLYEHSSRSTKDFP